MIKNKIKDFYIAGLVLGIIGGIFHNLLLLLLISVGLKTRTYWKDMAEVFFNPPQVFTWYAQLFGLIASLAMAGVNGVLIAVLLKVTGRDYLYIKSISASTAMGFAVFMVVYPALGLDFLQHSIITNYVALFTFIFYGVVVGFMFDKFTDFEVSSIATAKYAVFSEAKKNSLVNLQKIFKPKRTLVPTKLKKPIRIKEKSSKKNLSRIIKIK